MYFYRLSDDVLGNIVSFLEVTDYVYFMRNPYKYIYEYTASSTDTDDYISQFTRLRVLDLHDNAIILGDCFRTLKHLRELRLSSKSPTFDEHTFNGLYHLVTLDCGLLWDDTVFAHLHHIRHLICNKNTQDDQLASLPVPDELQTLDCRNAYITGSVLQRFCNLRKLYCNTYKCDYEDDDLKCLRNLEVLNCGANNTFTDKVLSYLPNLRVLIYQCATLFTDEGFKHVPNLQKLWAPDVTLLSFDKGLSYVPHLKDIFCGSTFTDVGLRQLPELQSIQLSVNSLISIHGICNPANLLKLHCGDDDNIDDKALRRFVNLQALVCNNMITDKGIRRLKQLRWLTCNRNITDKGLKHLRNLRHLNCWETFILTNDFTLYTPNLVSLVIGSNNTLVTKKGINRLVYLREFVCTMEHIHTIQGMYIDKLNVVTEYVTSLLRLDVTPKADILKYIHDNKHRYNVRRIKMIKRAYDVYPYSNDDEYTRISI